MKTLLLAESHPPTLEHLTGLLSQAGYTVRAVNDAVVALEHFSADNPDVVVLSVDLPRVEGQHVVQLIRGHSQGGRVPIVAIDKGHLGRARGVGSVLDLGAGCGIQALLAARHADRVVASDLNPRAVGIAAFNAALNEVAVDCVEGDLFESCAASVSTWSSRTRPS